MPTIDERVVEMRFDNENFERNAKESMNTLDKLKSALNLDQSAKSLENLQNESNKFSLAGMSAAIGAVSEKFSALEIAGIAAITRLTNQGMAMMERFVKSVSIDQITAGWQKYADKTSAVQTIMAATAKDFEDTGVQMEYVNEQLDKLNWFTDETSYSFLDMVNNIGKFTSNSIKLDTSVTAMQGISTWAAISGANVGEAGRAMYNLAQAISVGSVKLMDWKSIENANMATTEFKETAIETAIALGTLRRQSDGTVTTLNGAAVSAKNFNSELSSGWFTSDVLLKTLNRYGEFTNRLYEFSEATGETATRSLQLAESYEKGELNLTEYAKSTGVSVTKLTTMLDGLIDKEMDLGRRSFQAAQEAKTFREAIDSVKDAVSTGWMTTFEYIFGNYQEAKKVWTGLANELYDIFADGGNDRNEILKMWHNGIYEAVEDTDEMLLKTAGAYEAFIGSISNMWQGIKNIIAPIQNAFDDIFGKSNAEKAQILIDLTNKFYDFSEKFKNAFQDIEEIVTETIAPVTEMTEAVEEIVDPLAKTAEVLDDLANAVIRGDYGNGEERVRRLRELGYSYELVQNRVQELLGLEKIYEIEQPKVTQAIKETKKELINTGEETFRTAQELSTAQKRFQNLQRTFAGLFAAIDIGKTVVSELAKTIGRVFSHLWERVVPVADAILEMTGDLGDYLVEVRDTINENGKLQETFEHLSYAINTGIDWIITSVGKLWRRISTSDAIGRLSESLGKLKDVALELGMAGLDKLGGFLTDIGTSGFEDGVIDVIGAIVDFGADKLAEFIDWIVNHKEDIGSFFGLFTDAVASGIGAVSTAFTNLWAAISGYSSTEFAEVSNLFHNIGEAVNQQLENPDSIFNQLTHGVQDFWDALVERIANFDPEHAANVFKEGAIGMLILAIGELLHAISGGIGSIADVPAGIVKVLDSLSGSLVAYQNNIKADILIKIAKAIGIFAIALIGLSFVPQDDLNKATASLTLIMGMIALIMFIYSKILSYKPKLDVTEFITPLNKFLNAIKLAIANAARVASFGLLFAGLGVAVVAMGKVLMDLDKMDMVDFIKNLTKLGLIVTLAAGVIIAISNFSKGSMTAGFGVAMIGISVAIYLLVGAFAALSEIPGEKVGVGMFAIITLMGMLTVFSHWGGGANLIGLAAGMVILSGALTLMMVPIAALGVMPWQQLLQGGGAIIVLAGAMAALGWAMKKGDVDPKQLLALAGSIALLAIPLLLVGANAEKASYGFVILGIAMATIVGIAKLAEFAAKGIYLLTNGIQRISLSALMFGAACLAISLSISIVAKALPTIVDGLIYVGKAVKEHGAELALGFAAILIAIAAAIMMSKVEIATSVVGLINEIIGKIVAALPAFLQSAWTIIVGIFLFLEAVAPGVVVAIFRIVVSIINALADLIRNNFEPLLMAVLNLIDAILDAAWQAIMDAVGFLGEGIINFFAGMFGAHVDAEPAIDAVKAWGNNMVTVTTGSVDGAGSEAAANLATEFNDDLSSRDMTTVPAQKAEEAGDAFTDGLATSTEGIDFGEIMEHISGNFGDVSLDGFSTLGLDSGEGYMTSFADSMEDNMQLPIGAAQTTVESISTETDKLFDNGYTAGRDFDQGVANGIDDYVTLPQTAAANMGAATAAAARASLDEHSPSKVGMQIGSFFDKGVSIGIDKDARLVSDASGGMAKTAIDKAKEALSRIKNYINSDLEAAPTITPVLDLTNLQNGANSINSMFSSQTMRLAGINDSLFDRNQLAYSAQLEALNSNADVVSAITDLRYDVNQLNNAMSSMQVVMDSGQLVGSIARGMDSALGRINTYKGRGI